jgi:bifunctional DNA-binding transcriptional regulator/antitoxin component of YhaV-PrlF toxin-antitoxin module
MAITEEEGDITVLTIATTTSKSLRTTVPISIVRQLKLREGDRLRWQIKAEDGNLTVLVEPLKADIK